MLRRFLTTAAFAALGLAGATAGHAQAVTVDLSIYDRAEKTLIQSPGGFNGQAFSAPFEMTITSGPGAGESLYVFCVDVFDTVAGHATGLSYTPTTLFGYDGGSSTLPTLPATKVSQISSLIGYGESLIGPLANPSTIDAQLAGVQDAIWSTEYGGDAGFSFTPGSQAAATYEQQDLNNLSLLAPDPNVSLFLATNGDTQGLAGGSPPDTTAPSNAGVPEPAAWALMILGIGMTGTSLRRQRLSMTP